MVCASFDIIRNLVFSRIKRNVMFAKIFWHNELHLLTLELSKEQDVSTSFVTCVGPPLMEPNLNSVDVQLGILAL